jgi:4-aminobutyrate aminotransferase-like enzyme
MVSWWASKYGRVQQQRNCQQLLDAGLLVLTAGTGMRLLPPLVITREEMDAGIAIMKSVLA